jgi:hypothetical protein
MPSLAQFRTGIAALIGVLGRQSLAAINHAQLCRRRQQAVSLLHRARLWTRQLNSVT